MMFMCNCSLIASRTSGVSWIDALSASRLKPGCEPIIYLCIAICYYTLYMYDMDTATHVLLQIKSKQIKCHPPHAQRQPVNQLPACHTRSNKEYNKIQHNEYIL